MKTTLEKTTAATAISSQLNKVQDFNGTPQPKDLPLNRDDETKVKAEAIITENATIKVTEVPAAKLGNVVLNLESTLKLVEELHRKKIQRDRLIETIELLAAFEVAQQEEAEETGSNHFQGCVLTIEDDERRKFSTKNPVLIDAVAQFVNQMCTGRLTEIKAGITIPA